jgi:hypothetical protein
VVSRKRPNLSWHEAKTAPWLPPVEQLGGQAGEGKQQDQRA